MRTCFSKETKPPTDQSNIWFFDEKQCAYGRKVCWWNFLININEILDVSISFLNDHLGEALGSAKIEENHSKCITKCLGFLGLSLFVDCMQTCHSSPLSLLTSSWPWSIICCSNSSTVGHVSISCGRPGWIKQESPLCPDVSSFSPIS